MPFGLVWFGFKLSNMETSEAFEILNQALDKLSEARTPHEYLMAVSDYARNNGASCGLLMYIDQTTGISEIVATWDTFNQHKFYIKERIETLIVRIPTVDLSTKMRPTFFPNIEEHNFRDTAGKQWLMHHQVVAMAQLPLYHKERWLGVAYFVWHEIRSFTERDILIFTALQQQLIPIVESARLLEESQQFSSELVRVSNEIQTLFTSAQGLNQALTVQEQLEAISEYARQNGATQGVLSYVDDPNNPLNATTVAEWVTNEEHRVGIGAKFETLQLRFVLSLMTLPVHPTLIDDMFNYPTIDAEFLAIAQHYQVKAGVVMPIHSSGRWIGFVWFTWNSVQNFTKQDERLYSSLLNQLAGVVDSLRLLNQIRLRASELEVANAEIDLLYRTSESINSVTNYQELLEAVAPFDPDADAVAMMLWQHWDYHSADYIEPVALLVRTHSPIQANEHLPKAGFPVCEIMWGERVWLFEDTQTDLRVDPISRQSFESIGSRAFLGAALYVQQRWIGGITFHSYRPRRYSEREVRLFTAIGDLVLAAVERIRLQAEKEVTHRRTEMLAKVDSALTRAIDETTILDAISLYVEELNIQSIVLTYINIDEKTGQKVLRPMAIWREGQANALEAPSPNPYQYLNSTFEKHVANHPDKPLFVEDVLTDVQMQEQKLQEFFLYTGIGSLVVLPLVIGGQHYGNLRVTWASIHQFSDDERIIFSSLVQTLSAVVANRRNYLAEQQRARELAAVARVSATAASILDEQGVLQALAKLTHEEFAEYDVLIHILDESSQYLSPVKAYNGSQRIALQDALFLVAQTARTRQSTIVNDIRRASMYRFHPINNQVQSIMALPLIASDLLIGVLEIQSDAVNRFSKADIRIMGTLADLIAIAIQNARLYAGAQALAALQERNRLARELHDSVSQALYGIALGARAAHKALASNPERLPESLDYVLTLAEAGLAEMRALIFELRPETLEKEGLIEALNKQVTMLRSRYKLIVNTEFCPEPDVSLKIKEALYWIAREALHNVIKHARAKNVQLRVSYGENLVLSIADDGVGFNPHADFTGHLGLRSIRERSEQINATLTLTSNLGMGSLIQTTIKC